MDPTAVREFFEKSFREKDGTWLPGAEQEVADLMTLVMTAIGLRGERDRTIDAYTLQLAQVVRALAELALEMTPQEERSEDDWLVITVKNALAWADDALRNGVAGEGAAEFHGLLNKSYMEITGEPLKVF